MARAEPAERDDETMVMARVFPRRCFFPAFERPAPVFDTAGMRVAQLVLAVGALLLGMTGTVPPDEPACGGACRTAVVRPVQPG